MFKLDINPLPHCVSAMLSLVPSHFSTPSCQVKTIFQRKSWAISRFCIQQIWPAWSLFNGTCCRHGRYIASTFFSRESLQVITRPILGQNPSKREALRDNVPSRLQTVSFLSKKRCYSSTLCGKSRTRRSRAYRRVRDRDGQLLRATSSFTSQTHPGMDQTYHQPENAFRPEIQWFPHHPGREFPASSRAASRAQACSFILGCQHEAGRWPTSWNHSERVICPTQDLTGC